MGFTRKGARAALAFLPSLAITTLLSARVPAVSACWVCPFSNASDA